MMRLKQVFDTFDGDGSHKIDVVELKAMMESLGINATTAQVTGLIQGVDSAPEGEGEQGDGEIDFGEVRAAADRLAWRAQALLLGRAADPRSPACRTVL